jgi:putative flavoprotein involved in K+ transport
MDAIGQLDERWDETEELARARRLPSLQLVGSPERRDIDLNALAAQGVRLAGRLAGVVGTKAQFSGSLANVCALADLKQVRLLDRIDEWAAETGLDPALPPPVRPARTELPSPPLNTVDLAGERISTVVWATGFRPHFPWLDDALKDRKGYPRHDGGVVEAPGLYVMGLPFTRRRKSSFIDGVGPDAQELSAHLADHLAGDRHRSSTAQGVAA